MGAENVLNGVEEKTQCNPERFSPIPATGTSSPGPKMDSPPPRVRLAQLAREAAGSCVEKPCANEFQYRGDGPYLSRELLSVLTFSYGTGVFTLERIDELMQKDVLYFSLIGHKVPKPETLRGFRRLERLALTSSLGKFFELSATACQEHASNPVEHEPWLEVLKLTRPIPRCTHSLGRLVRERVNQATWIDKMLLDY